MERFRPILPQTNYFLDPLQQLGSPNGNEESVVLGVDALKNSHSTETFHFTNSNSKNFISKMDCSSERTNLCSSMPYLEEWETVCKCSDLAQFRSWAFGGDLSASRFRSVCWRVYLCIIPTESSKWLSIIRSKREFYEMIRHELMVTPGLKKSLDPNVDNPLSQDEESPWNQYFEDSELKRLIRLDVQRTFPEVEFFQSKRIQEMLVSILFCYARKYPKISYIQGMHEVLAPLAFVLNYDLHMHKNSSKDSASKNLLTELMDEAHLEHDSFTIFEAVMEKLQPWYEDGDPKRNFPEGIVTTKIVRTQPFARPQDIGPTTKIVQKLTRIFDNLVKEHEPEIYAHLNRLEIAPQLFGIRWVRLMFGREFSFTDVLMIWDAIFADGYSDFVLIDYLVVAMLAYVKDELLVSDHMASLNIIMRFPQSPDVQSIIQAALYYRNPKGSIYPGKCVNSIPSKMTTVGGQPNIHRAPQHGVITRSKSVPRPPPSSSTSLKHRSTSVDQHTRISSGNGERRKSSPTIEESNCAFGTTSGLKAATASSANATSTTTKVVSGLARLGEKFGTRTRELTPQHSAGIKERQMDELKFQERSSPIKAKVILRDGSFTQTSSNSCSSSEEEEDPTFPQKNIVSSQRLSVEDVLAVSLGCALKLSRHHEDLAKRFSQLNIESDFTIRSAMEGISEAIENLRELKGRVKRKSTTDQPKSLPAFTHPLMYIDKES